MLLYLSTVAIFLCLLHYYFKYNEATRLLRKIPGPKDTFFVGNALDVIVSPVKLFNLGREYARMFNGIYSWHAFKINIVNIYNPEDIETIISSSKHNDKGLAYHILKPWLQEGLLLSNGSKWQERRKILTPAFHFNILRQFHVILEDNSHRLVENLAKTKGDALDIVPVLSEYTLSSICETAMGTRLHEQTMNAGKIYKEAIYELGKLCVDRFTKLYYASDFVFNLSSPGRNSKKHLNTIKSFTKRVIEERKDFVQKHGIKITDTEEIDDNDVFLNKKRKRIAMLDLLILAGKDGVIDRKGIQEEVDTFMFEGHDTTASGLTYCLMLLANHKNIQDKIVEELQDVFGDSTRQATTEDLSMMRYLERCIKESLRLYPPVPFISRSLTEPVQLGKYTLPANTECNIHIYDLHRREDLFKNAHEFDPDRFLPENSVGRHTYAYIPFSAGPRNCIGQRFAMMEMKSCVAALLRKFELLPVTQPSDLVFTADLVLRHIGPVYVKFEERINNQIK